MKGGLLLMLLLTTVWNTFGEIDLPRDDFLPRKRVIEIVKWRQPICVMPVEGVPLCPSQEKIQVVYEHSSAKGSNEGESDQTKPIKEEPSSTTPRTENTTVNGKETLLQYIGQYFLNEILADPKGTLKMDVKFTKQSEDSTQRHTRTSSKTYVTKVLESPTTAILVAHGCLPNIDLPLCTDDQARHLKNVNKETDKLIHGKSHEDQMGELVEKFEPYNWEAFVSIKLDEYNTSNVVEFSRTLKNEFYSFLVFFHTTVLPMIDFLLPGELKLSDEFWKKEVVDYLKHLEKFFNIATNVLKFLPLVIPNAGYTNLIDTVETCLRNLKLRILIYNQRVQLAESYYRY